MEKARYDQYPTPAQKVAEKIVPRIEQAD